MSSQLFKLKNEIMFKDKIVWKVDTFLLLTYDKVFILEVIDRQNNNICNKKLTNMFTIIVSFRSTSEEKLVQIILNNRLSLRLSIITLIVSMF